MMIVYPRETPPHIRTARASPQRHTAVGTAAPTTADTENTVSQRATPTQTAYALQISEGRRTIKELEDKILQMLADSSGNILDDEDLINTLDQSKKTSARYPCFYIYIHVCIYIYISIDLYV